MSSKTRQDSKARLARRARATLGDMFDGPACERFAGQPWKHYQWADGHATYVGLCADIHGEPEDIPCCCGRPGCAGRGALPVS